MPCVHGVSAFKIYAVAKYMLLLLLLLLLLLCDMVCWLAGQSSIAQKKWTFRILAAGIEPSPSPVYTPKGYSTSACIHCAVYATSCSFQLFSREVFAPSRSIQ
jgi:hypothetical protein